MTHVKQQSHGRKKPHTHRKLRFVLQPLEIVHLFREYKKTLKDVRIYDRAMHSDRLDRIQSQLKSLYVNYYN